MCGMYILYMCGIYVYVLCMCGVTKPFYNLTINFYTLNISTSHTLHSNTYLSIATLIHRYTLDITHMIIL